MKITVVGTGNMGAAFVKQLQAAGHQVCVTGRNAEKAAALAAQFHGVQAVPSVQAAAGADAIVLATGYGDAVAALRSLGALDKAVVIDIS
jgi:8-hydroxy-5-deazaflavin:NADPH oxidoreductase